MNTSEPEPGTHAAGTVQTMARFLAATHVGMLVTIYPAKDCVVKDRLIGVNVYGVPARPTIQVTLEHVDATDGFNRQAALILDPNSHVLLHGDD